MKSGRFLLGMGIICCSSACGYTHPGVGTQTLEINATLYYNWQKDSTHADVWLNRAGLGVADANVLLLDAEHHLQETVLATTTAGHFYTVLPGYPRRVQLSIRAGSDGLVCQIEGPGRHLITAPAPGTVVAYGEDLPIRWTTEDGVRADNVTISLSDVAWRQQIHDDQGRASIPTHVLAPGFQTVTVQRRSNLVPSGAAGHSHVDMVYAVSTPFQVRAVR